MADFLPHLETFALAAETGNFTAAARTLEVTQAAVSQRIAALEKDIGVPLFARTGGRVQLTEAGRRLLEYSRQIQVLHDQARAEVTGLPVSTRGDLSIAASTVPAEYLLPDLLASFQSRHPNVHLRMRVTDSDEVCDLVARGQAHLGLAGKRPSEGELVAQRIARDELILVVSPKHPWAKQKCVTLEDLKATPLIVRESGSGARHCLEQALARAGHSLSDFPVALELGSNEAINAAVRRGLGVAFLSSLAVAAQPRPLPSVRVGCLDLGRDLYVVHDRRRALPIPARLFLDLLLEASTA